MYSLKKLISSLLLVSTSIHLNVAISNAQDIDCSVIPPLNPAEEKRLLKLLEEVDYSWEVDKLLGKGSISHIQISKYMCTVVKRTPSWRALVTTDVALMFKNMEQCLPVDGEGESMEVAELTLHPSVENLLKGNVDKEALKRCMISKQQDIRLKGSSMLRTCTLLARDFDEYQIIKKVEHLYRSKNVFVMLSKQDDNLLKAISVLFTCEKYL